MRYKTGDKNFKYLFLVVLWTFTGLTYSQVPSNEPIMQTRVYKTNGLTSLKLHIYQPSERNYMDKLPVIVFFHGGGFNERPVWQFKAQCQYLVEQRMVAILASYRTNNRLFDCIADSKSTIRWLRTHAIELGIDENRITAAGGSAGGYLAACTGLVKDFDEENEDLSISSVPNALVLFNPALDLPAHLSDTTKRLEKPTYHAKKLIRCLKGRAIEISPFHYIAEGAPPTIIFHGTADKSVDFHQAIRFYEEMKKYGNNCEVVLYEGRDHGFFFKYYGDEDFTSTMENTVKFLTSLGYIKDNTTIKY
ncbi:MAG: alpha/beta hydrolase [Bacteroidales bacterium]|nr:alpha/beta hydrolase [Bacteroidales bacterium]